MRLLLVAVYIVALIVTGLPRLTLSGAKLELSAAGSGSSTDLLLAGLADDNDDDPICEALPLSVFADRCIQHYASDLMAVTRRSPQSARHECREDLYHFKRTLLI